MTAGEAFLAIDQGTTSSRAIVFDAQGRPRASAQRPLQQHYPRSGWVEHDAAGIWEDVRAVTRAALQDAADAGIEVVAAGITNQRETAVVWDRSSGEPIHRALVWQDRRTADACARLRAAGHEQQVQERTGLVLDPYFSATKFAWILDHVDGARERAARGELAAGTVDSWLLWKLTGGAVHATDATNASRTLLFDLRAQEWDDGLLDLFGVPRALLPEVRDCAADYGHTVAGAAGAAIPLRGVAGDQQAATVGQCCFQAGMMKSTYGTGCFAVLNTGDEPLPSRNRLLSTVAYRFDGAPTFAIEGSIFHAGTVMQWLRDGLGLFEDAAVSASMAAGAADERRVYLVPAFTGLGAPHWDPHARGAIHGITRDADRADLVRAGLEAVCFQTRDLLEAARADGAELPDTIRVDGGMVANDWLLQRLADLIAVPVERPRVAETTALGAAACAALGAGAIPDLEAVNRMWHRDARFEPRMGDDEREERYAGWKEAVQRTLTGS